MAIVERTYTIPLRREWLKSVRYKRAKKAVRAIREFLARHMKVREIENIKLGKYLNMELWKHGIRNPPPRIKVNVTKDDKGVVMAELFGAPREVKKEEPQKGEKKAEEKKAEPATKPAKAKSEKVKPAAPKQTVPKESAPVKEQTGQIIR